MKRSNTLSTGDLWNRIYLAMYALYIVVGLSARLAGWMHGDALVYLQSSRRVVDGSFDLYTLLRTPYLAPPLGTTYAYSPFMAIVVAPFVYVSDALRLGNIWGMKLMGIPLLFIDLLAMQQLRHLARRYRPNIDERFLFLGIALSLFVTSFLFVTAYKSHIEGMVLLFLLLTLRALPHNLLLAGLWAGLALSAKHMTALLSLIPIGMVLLAAPRASHSVEQEGGVLPGAQPGGLRDALRLGAIAAGVFAVFMLPAVLRNLPAVQYALITQAQRIVPLGPGVPRWLNWALESNLSPLDYAAIRPNLLALSNLLLLMVVTLVPSVVVWLLWRRGRPISLFDTRLLGLVAFGGVSYVLFAKWVSDNYYQMPLALVFLWDVVRSTPQRVGIQTFPWVGIGAMVAYRLIAMLDPELFPALRESPAPLVMDVLQFLLFATLAVMILRWVMRFRQNWEIV